MKILDVDLFQDGIQRNITMLDRLSSEMEAIHHAVNGLVQMEDQLKGAGGNAIRSFYQECHLPFLHFFQLFSEQFKQVLNQMEAALHSLEPDSSGYILETFLDGELEQGLTLIGELTASLTDEANSIMDQVSDIVALSHLDDSGVQEGVISSKRKRDDTLMQLYEFDALQTYALNPIEQGLQTMDTWLTDMEGLFQAGVKDINFLPSQWDVLTYRSDIRTELFPKVFLDPNYLWVREQEQLIGTMITAPTFQTLEGKKVKTIEENVEENIKYHEYDNGLLVKEYVVGQTVFYEVVSKVEYKEEETVKVDKPKENKILDSLQFGLDIAGLIPVVGEIADGANGLIYTARGDALNATLSFSAMIPVVGMASTGGKLAVKGSKAVEEAQDASKVADNVIDGAKGTGNLGISNLTQGSPGNVIFGQLDNLGRPTGVIATITQDMIGTGSKASQSILPPGFLGGGPGSPGHARGHLLGNQLGGSGKDARNLVTLYQLPVNSPVMRDFETSVRSAVDRGEDVRYLSIPIYEGNTLMPKGVTLKARGTNGFSLDVTILNKK